MGLDLGFVSGCKAVSEDARVALIRKPETWGEGRLMSQTNSEDSAWQ